MAKFSLITVLLLCLGITSNAQKAVLQKDEGGKYVYYEVVDCACSKDVLAKSSKQFFSDLKKVTELKSTVGDTAFIASGKFILSKTASAISHPSGEVLYKLNIELRDKKYRYLFSEFKFIPYQRDRYGNFVPATVYGTPLENDPGKLNAAEWKSYVSNTAEQAKRLSITLKKYMAGEAQKKIVDKPVNTKW